MSKQFWEVEVSNSSDTVAALFDSLEAAKRYADDCEDIAGVRIVVCTGPYTVFSTETVWKAYMRTWDMFNGLKEIN